MPYVYIGRRNFYYGKSLWEILSNLRDFGVGRIVYRSKFKKAYPEPTYYKILKVAALPDPEPYVERGTTYNDTRKIIALVEKTFRGKTHEKLVQLEAATYKNDFRLLPKDEEEEFCRKVELQPQRILPMYGEYPPLLKQFIIRSMKLADPNADTSNVKLKMKYKIEPNKGYRVAKEGETPTVDFSFVGEKLSPHLYE